MARLHLPFYSHTLHNGRPVHFPSRPQEPSDKEREQEATNGDPASQTHQQEVLIRQVSEWHLCGGAIDDGIGAHLPYFRAKK